MRPNQNKRMRGRNRKPQNISNKTFESNGPDVKIRGNAGQIAEKYQALGRDALASGERILAENYFQHAEHYNRILAAATQAQNDQPRDAQNARQAERDAEDDDEQRQPAQANGRARDDRPVETGANGEENAGKGETSDQPRADRPARKRGRPRKQETASDAEEASAGDGNEEAAAGSVGGEELDAAPRRRRPRRRRIADTDNGLGNDKDSAAVAEPAS